MNKILLVGDVHQKLDHLKRLLTKKNFDGPVVQLGDLGFNYDKLSDMPGNPFRFLGGNHDNYLAYKNCPESLGDYGTLDSLGRPDVFFIRGGLSIDKKYRTRGFDWFPEEQLTDTEFHDCLAAYSVAKPEIVISHECPQIAIPHVAQFSDEYIVANFGCSLPSKTSVFLQNILMIHLPKYWIFGHYHVSKSFRVDGADFRCLSELECCEI